MKDTDFKYTRHLSQANHSSGDRQSENENKHKRRMGGKRERTRERENTYKDTNKGITEVFCHFRNLRFEVILKEYKAWLSRLESI